MNQETKTIPNLKPTSGNQNNTVDKKTRAEYVLESEKIPSQALENGIATGIVLVLIMLINLINSLPIIGSISDKLVDIFGYSFFFAIFVFIVSFCILQSKLKTKYKIPNIYRNMTDNKMTSSSHSLEKIWSSNLDLDSSIPGSAANSTRRMFDKMRLR